MVKVIFEQKPWLMNGNQLLNAVLEKPEGLWQSAVGDRKEYIQELCAHIADCCDCEASEYFVASDDPGCVKMVQLGGLEFARQVLDRYGLRMRELYRMRRAIFKDDYRSGFCHQIDMRYSWQALLSSNSSKAYAQGLMDAETLENLIETM